MKKALKRSLKHSSGLGVHSLLDVAVAADLIHTVAGGAYSILWIIMAIVPAWLIFRTFIAWADSTPSIG